MNIIAHNIDSFMQKIYENPNHRYTSWEICYQAFEDENLNNDIKALHLGGYLCSWGMYRGSSNLLNEYNYMVFIDLIPILNEYMDLRKDFLEEDDYRRFLELVENIKNFLNDKNISPTDTLITKIILGVYGCFLALDNYFIKGYRKSVCTFSNKILIKFQEFNIFYNSLKSFYFSNQGGLESKRMEIKYKRNVNYPPMKLIDMFFWEYGNNILVLEKIKKRLQDES